MNIQFTTSLIRMLSVLCLVFVMGSIAALSYSGGITGRTVTACGSCHSGTSTNTTLSFTGSTTVNAGSTNSLTFVLQNSSRPRAGFNMDFVNSSNTQISGLAVVSGQGSYMSGNEMTHSSAKTISGGQATWQFTLNAPTTPGIYTIRVAGNATQSGSQGDSRAHTQTIIVRGITITAPTVGSAYCVGGTLPIQWNSFGATSVNIQMSSDGGATYSTVATPSATNGANTFNYTIPTSTTPGTTYRVRVVDAADATVLSAMNGDFSITSGVTITTQPSPANRTVCQGATVSYSLVASGASPAYQWRKDGTIIPGATVSLLTLSNVTSSQAGSYDCVVSSSCGSPQTSVPVTLAIDPATTITTQPSAANVCEGSPVNLTIVAAGSALQYQWKKGGADIPGATRSTLGFPMVTQGDAGSYTCVVSGTCGTPITSSPAAVTVSSVPTFTVQPKDVTQCDGTAATLSATLSNASGLSFEWLKDGVVVNASARVTGVTTQTLSIASLQSSDAGLYQLRAFSPVCAATVSSSNASLIVRSKPFIATQPQSRTVAVGAAVEFSVATTGTGATYQWRKDGNVIVGQTQSTYTVSAVAKSDAGSYSVVVTNDCGSVTSTAAVLTVSDVAKPEIVVQGTLAFGTMKIGAVKIVRVSVNNTGSEPVTIQSMAISGTDASDFRVDTAMPVIPPSSSVMVPVQCTFSKVGTITALVTIKSNAANEPVITCSATGVIRAVQPAAVIFVDSAVVGSVRDTTIQMCNTTSETLESLSYTLTGDDKEFALTQSGPGTLFRDSCALLQIRFTPTRAGRAEARIAVKSSQGSDTIIVSAVGKSVASSVSETLYRTIAYPSPASDFIRVYRHSQDVGTVLVYIIDAQGRRLFSDFLSSDELTVSVQHLAAGVYTIVLEAGDKRYYQSLPILR